MLLNSSVNPAFDEIPMVARESFPSERLIRAGRNEEYITIFQIADWILRIVNQKTIQKEWKNQNA
jgi:hypothetical protein